MTYTFNTNNLSNYRSSAYEIGERSLEIYEYTDDDFKVEYIHRTQLVESDTDTGADFWDEQYELNIVLNGERTSYATEEWLTYGEFQDLTEWIIQGLNHGYSVDEMINRW